MAAKAVGEVCMIGHHIKHVLQREGSVILRSDASPVVTHKGISELEFQFVLSDK